MEKIENLHARQICFSNHRKGLFRKATLLCDRGGGEVAIVIFSSAGNLYCYGCPGVDAVIRRYFKRQFASAAADDNGRSRQEVMGQEQGSGEGGGGGAAWWDVPVEGLELHVLEVLHEMLRELKEKADEASSNFELSLDHLELSLKPPPS